MIDSDSSRAAKVKDLLNGKLEKLDSSSSTQLAAKKLLNSNSNSLVLTDASGNPTGIITERDLVRKICAFHKRSSQIIAKDIMSSPIITVDLNASLRDAANEMIQHKVRHLLVLDEGKARGVISANDFANYLKQGIDMDDVNAAILESLLNIREAGIE